MARSIGLALHFNQHREHNKANITVALRALWLHQTDIFMMQLLVKRDLARTRHVQLRFKSTTKHSPWLEISRSLFAGITLCSWRKLVSGETYNTISSLAGKLLQVRASSATVRLCHVMDTLMPIHRSQSYNYVLLTTLHLLSSDTNYYFFGLGHCLINNPRLSHVCKWNTKTHIQCHSS